ncbi:MAG TPA: ATP-binding protein [Acidobacteriaceae bacterium]|jgi:signal transduction histidine kinase|nr:ATP-binding protein [Acidobacteriaceae bacterium]
MASTSPVTEHKSERKSSTEEIIAALRKVSPLEGLRDEDYRWLAEHGTEQFAAEGDIIFREGEPVSMMNIMLRGEIHVRRLHSGPMALFIGRAGQIGGLLPFSRMKTYGGEGRCVGEGWSLNIRKEDFDAMLKAIPSMAQRCVTVLLSRVREVTRLEQQAEKLNALGKLSGNLSHELNNPASAAQRAARTLLGELRHYGDQKYQLGSMCLDAVKRARYSEWVAKARAATPAGTLAAAVEPDDQAAADAASHALAQADREDAINRWLEAHAVGDAWQVAPTLAEANINNELLDDIASFATPEVLPVALRSFASALRAERMTEAVIDSTARIFDLIRAIKAYSYMDQAAVQDVDLAAALDNTLTMLSSRMNGIKIKREYAKDVPLVNAYGSELNQVWTALIENALDAMPNGGTLKLKVSRSGEMALVEVWDSGPGIAPDLMDRIFEPFFTTKAVGAGLGLGLDTAQRIVARHRGFVTVESKPGATCFQVRLPLELTEAY